MAEFKYIRNPITGIWTVLDPRRSKRPNIGKRVESVCPFCIGRESEEQEYYRIGEENTGWQVRVVSNRFPFAPVHEIIIHSPDHHKNFDEFPLEHTELILKTYRQRYNTHKAKGRVYIFHNRGVQAGESLPHPHSQLTVVDRLVNLNVPILGRGEMEVKDLKKFSIFNLKFSMNFQFSKTKKDNSESLIGTDYFWIFCPETSQWPDEVWVAPRKNNGSFGDIKDKEITDLAFILFRLIQILNLRHGREFPFNFYIYPGENWYLRIIPRIKTLGGFEVGTGIFVNTQSPTETIQFIKKHFKEPDLKKIEEEDQADYWKTV